MSPPNPYQRPTQVPGQSGYGQQYQAYPGGGFTPPPKKRSLKWLWIGLTALGVVVVLGIVAVVLIVHAVTKDNVYNSDDVAVGDCVRVEKSDESSVKPVKVNCSDTGFHHSVAAKVDNGS